MTYTTERRLAKISLQAFQNFEFQNLIKGIVPMIALTDKVIKAKKEQKQMVAITEVYDFAVPRASVIFRR